MSELFKVGFHIEDYQDILPSVHKYRNDGDEVMNLDEDDLDKCVWVKQPPPAVITKQFIKREVNRVLRTGFWFILKGEPVWLSPNLYFFYQYFNTGGAAPEFRLNRLMSTYEKIRVRNNPRALGTYNIKSRQIGETTFEMSDCLWEAANLDFALIGVQSKTRQTVVNSCWRTLIMGWNGIPKWLKEAIYSEFSSGDNVAETMKFVKQADEHDSGKNVMIAYAAGSHNAFDSVSNMRRCVLDEWNKWEEASPYQTFLNYEKFIATGTSRKGLFSIFSSPADMETKYIQECYDFWKGSDPANLNFDPRIENDKGTTDTRIFRQFISPLTGIEGFYDKWGDADADQIYDWIIKKRKSVPKEYRMAEIRAYPLTEEEIFGSFEGGHVWSNHSGILERKIYIIGSRFKDATTQEPARLYGNLEWREGVKDSEVDFRQSDKDHFDLYDSRFVISYLPKNREPLRINSNGIPMPPPLIQDSLGIDPIDKRYASAGRGFSNAAMTNWIFSDVFQTGIVKCPSLYYSCRPGHAEVFFEDAIKAAVFNRAMVQTESINSKIIDYFDDRGYIDWMLSKRGQPRNSMIKGDSPGGGKNIFLTEIMSLINSVTNTPLVEGDAYLLEKFWFPELLEDILKFNPKDTHTSDGTMSLGQSLMGAVKILHRRIRKPSSVNGAVLNFLLT